MNIKQNPENIKEHTSALADHVGDLAESYYRLGLLNVTEKASEVAAFTCTLFMLSFLSLFVILFLGFGFGWWLGQRFENMLAGFSVVAGIFTALIILIMALRKKVLFPLIRNIVIKKVYE